MKIDSVNIQKAAQAALVREATSAHFYTEDGQARYSDTVKTGPNKGKECAVNLRHARNENLFPSITHIHNVLSERALRFYRESHLLAAARKLDPHPNESEVDYYHRVNIESRKDSMEAAQRGTDVHKSLEAMLKGGKWDTSDPLLVQAEAWISEHIDETMWTEETLVNYSLRLAGRCDALVFFKQSSKHFKEVEGRDVILDFKTRRFKKQSGKWLAPYYPKDVRQVAFYASCVPETKWCSTPRAANLLLNTTPEAPPDLPPQLILYPKKEQFDALVSVAHLAAVWRHENNYFPEATEIPIGEAEAMKPVWERLWG